MDQSRQRASTPVEDAKQELSAVFAEISMLPPSSTPADPAISSPSAAFLQMQKALFDQVQSREELE
ncbi:uncharacterized protein LOC122616233 [Drosophila teissieri]|uniref:uncharacterized protein LOC122616233 n=1 Tax=Drosophila teissieri TaxID=7243 RepID=UPI001CBA50B7|nr:uncharacterized protein LOC122616233 [Drosophila teissieri]